MKVYCTRPGCQRNENDIADELLESLRHTAFRQQQYCVHCGMPLILANQYLPRKELGSGGFGRTFCALDLNTAAEEPAVRVIKQLHPIKPLQPSQLQTVERLFRREAKVLDGLNHTQIPRLYAFFELVEPVDSRGVTQLGEPQKFFYLVQEYIDGYDLLKELEERKVQGKNFSEAEVIEILKQMLEILKYTHEYSDERGKGVIHRDIKPSNIVCRKKDKKLYLIDFGAVKQVIQVVEEGASENETLILTPGFSPPEQINAKRVQFSSDLYSLAATCVFLLTGENPGNIGIPYDLEEWKKHTTVTKRFAAILDKMLSPFPPDRFQSAEQILQALKQQSWKWWKVGLVGSASVAAIAIVAIIYKILTSLQQPQLPANYFSLGEKSLFNESDISNLSPKCQQAYEKKKEGIQAFAAQNFPVAKDKFQAAIDLFKASHDINCSANSETQVFLNNAKANISNNPLTIAIVVPINGKPQFSKIAAQMLRGVAHVQDNLNNKEDGIQGRLLQVLIVKDDNNPDIAKKVALDLAKNNIPEKIVNNILGVVGHFSSDDTVTAGEIYQSNQLVTVSPTSTAVRQLHSSTSGYQFNLSKYVFRTSPSDTVAADNLFQYAQRNIGSGKAAIFFNSEQKYSTSLKEAFEKKFAASDVISCDVSKYRMDECSPKALGAKLVMLALSADEATEKVLLAIELNSSKIPLLGGDALYSDDKLSFGDKAKDLILAVPAHADLTPQWFQRESISFWGAQFVGWRTITAYDAAQVIVEGLKKQGNNPTRQGLYDVLNDPKFSIQGATGTVKFDESHDRKVDSESKNKLGVLVKVCQSEKKAQYKFCLVKQ